MKDLGFIFLFITLIGVFLGVILGSSLESHKNKREAIEAGCAKYVINEKTGASRFIYITNSLVK